MSKSAGNIATIREVLDRWGRETLLVFFLGGHWRKPIDFSDETMAQAAAQAEGFRDVFRGRVASRQPPAPGSASRPRSTTTSTRRRRSRSCTSGATTSCCAAALALFGLASLAEQDEAPAEVVELAERRARGARRERDFELADRLRARDRGGRLGDAGRAGRLHARATAVSTDLVYGRRAVREALRGRREVLEVLATERAVASEPWLAEAQAASCGPSAT